MTSFVVFFFGGGGREGVQKLEVIGSFLLINLFSRIR